MLKTFRLNKKEDMLNKASLTPKYLPIKATNRPRTDRNHAKQANNISAQL